MITRLRRAWEKNWPEVHVALRGGMPDFVYRRRPAETGACIPVFCYHTVDEQRFADDLEYLQRNGYTTLDADELVAHMEGHYEAPARSVVITIDDGMVDLYTTAFPLLRAFEARAVAFIAPGLHDQQRRRHTNRLCTWEELEEMHLSGAVDIQAHTLEHRVVADWPRASGIRGPEGWIALKRSRPLTLKRDLVAARLLLERRLRKQVQHMAFPQFAGTAQAVKLVLACGYKSAWWGMAPGRRGNGVGDPPGRIVRISGEFLQRLPGEGRARLGSIVRSRLMTLGPMRPATRPRARPGSRNARRALEARHT